MRELHGFRRIRLGPGQVTEFDFELSDRDLSTVDAQGKRAVVPGTVRFWVGGGQPVGREGLAKPSGVEGSFQLTAAKELSD